MKKLVLLFGVCFSIMVSGLSYAQEAPKVVVNGKELQSEAIIQNGRTLIPVRGVFEEIGFSVEWNDDEKMALIYNENYQITIKSGEESFISNGRTVYPDVPQQNINACFYIPLRAVSESIQSDVQWNNITKTAYITTITEQLEDKTFIGTNPKNGKPIYRIGGYTGFAGLPNYSNGINVDGNRVWFDMTKEEIINMLGTPSFEHESGTMINYKDTSIGTVNFDFADGKLMAITLFGSNSFDVQYGDYIYTHMDGEAAAKAKLGVSEHQVLYSREPVLVITDYSIKDDRGYTYIPISICPNNKSSIITIEKDIIK